MQSGSVEITPGKVFNEQDGETVDLEKLNRMVQEAELRVMAKSITAREIADNAITSDQLDVDLSAQLGVPDGSVTPGKLAAGFVLAVAKGGTGATSDSSARGSLGVDPALQYALFVHDLSTGVNADNGVANTFSKRPVTMDVNRLTGCSVTDGVITLAPGTYHIRGYGVLGCTYDNVAHVTMAGIFGGDSGDAADLLIQGSSNSLSADVLSNTNIPSFVDGEITLASESTITFRQYSNRSDRPLGYAANITGFSERYAALHIRRIGE